VQDLHGAILHIEKIARRQEQALQRKRAERRPERRLRNRSAALLFTALLDSGKATICIGIIVYVCLGLISPPLSIFKLFTS